MSTAFPQKWLKPTLVPDESFFAVINHNPHLGVKGSYKGQQIQYLPMSARQIVWVLTYLDARDLRVWLPVCLLTYISTFYIRARLLACLSACRLRTDLPVCLFASNAVHIFLCIYTSMYHRAVRHRERHRSQTVLHEIQNVVQRSLRDRRQEEWNLLAVYWLVVARHWLFYDSLLNPGSKTDLGPYA